MWRNCFAAVPLAEPQCQTERGRGHGPPPEDLRAGHRGEPQEAIHGRLHLRILVKKTPLKCTLY